MRQGTINCAILTCERNAAGRCPNHGIGGSKVEVLVGRCDHNIARRGIDAVESHQAPAHGDCEVVNGGQLLNASHALLARQIDLAASGYQLRNRQVGKRRHRHVRAGCQLLHFRQAGLGNKIDAPGYGVH